MNQLEVRLHSGCTVHFHPTSQTLQFSKDLVPRLGQTGLRERSYLIASSAHLSAACACS